MRLGPIGDWRPAPGRVWRLAPSAGVLRAAADAPVSPGPPSYLQEDHLAAYAALRAAGGTHRAWTGVATTLDGPYDGRALAAAVAAFVAAHEGHRTFFDLEVGRPPVRRLLGADALDGDALRMEPVELDVADGFDGADGFDEALRRFVDAHLSEAATPGAWPGFGLVAVEQDDGVAVLWACDHAFTDAGSQIMLAGELGALYAAARDGVEVGDAVDPATSEGFVGYVAHERAVATTFTGDEPEVEAWRTTLVAAGRRLPAFPLDLGLAPGESAPVRILTRDLVVGADRLAALDAACKAAGGRVPSAVVAAGAVAGLRLAGVERHLGVTVLGTRHEGPWARSQGWLCNFAPLDLDLAPHATTATLLAAAEQAFARARAVARMPVHVALGALLADGTLTPETLGSPQLLSYLDLRWMPAARDAGAAGRAHAAGLHFTGEGRTRNASTWFNRDGERLYVVCQVPATPTALESVGAYLDEVAAVLGGVAAGEEVALRAGAAV